MDKILPVKYKITYATGLSTPKESTCTTGTSSASMNIMAKESISPYMKRSGNQ